MVLTRITPAGLKLLTRLDDPVQETHRQQLGHLGRERLGALCELLRQARGERSMVEIAALAGVPVETLRKIETGRIPTPAFFTVVALAEAVGVPLTALAATADLAATASAPAILSA